MSQYRVGSWVRIRPLQAILETLDEDGCLERLPFMPEMAQMCGLRLRVFKRADKLCDTIDKTGMRRMQNTVLLEGLRCNGGEHGGCQAGCMILWKEAWLEPAQPPTAADFTSGRPQAPVSDDDMSHLRQCARPASRDGHYVCQITELKSATSRLHALDVRPYFRDFASGNVPLRTWLRGICIFLFNAVQNRRKGAPFPYLEPALDRRVTPDESLNLQPGELVQVRQPEEIAATLDYGSKNKGLYFDPSMLMYCGRRYVVSHRIERFIDERDGRLVTPRPSVALKDVFCTGDCVHFCPRSEILFWREIWLRRVPSGA
jgi:hypothetical protein